MKALPEATENAYWEHSLLKDLSYIKAHLRYRPKFKTFLPGILRVAFLLLLICAIAISIYVNVSENETNNTFTILMAVSALISFSGGIIRYLQSLKFISIATRYHIAENSLLVEEFLKNSHLAMARHPDIPEVFQILSRNLSAGREDREVLIFIADDKRILINSHFTNRGWGLFPSPRHHRQMARMLKDFINNQSHSTGLMHQNF